MSEYTFRMDLFLGKERTHLLSAPVEQKEDIQHLINDTLFSGIRCGALPNDNIEFDWQVYPVWPVNGNRVQAHNTAGKERRRLVTGLAIEIAGASHSFRKEYPIQALEHRVLQRRTSINHSTDPASLKTAQLTYTISAEPKAANSPPDTTVPSPASAMIEFEAEPLTMCFERRPMPAVDMNMSQNGTGDFPLFISQNIISEIRAHTRGNLHREVAGWLIGSVLQDTDSPELYVVIRNHLPARMTDGDELHIRIGHESWTAYHDDLTARGIEGDLCIWYHSHPWCPEQGTSKSGSSQPTAPLSTLFMSADDIYIHFHFFPQPFQTAIVVDPRAEHTADIGVWGYRDGMLVNRTIMVTPEEVLQC